MVRIICLPILFEILKNEKPFFKQSNYIVFIELKKAVIQQTRFTEYELILFQNTLFSIYVAKTARMYFPARYFSKFSDTYWHLDSTTLPFFVSSII